MPLLALGVAGMLVMMVLLGAVLGRVQDRARAQAAADAAALAGAADGRAAAAALASANDSMLVHFETDGNTVFVEVRTESGVSARARAERRLESVAGQ